MKTREYFSETVSIVSHPCHVVAGLARDTLEDDYFVYETPGEWTFAMGSIAEIEVKAFRTVFRDDRGEQSVPRSGKRLGEVPQLLAQIKVPDWRVYGIAAFELCYDVVDNDATLLHLIVPRIEARISEGKATIRGTDAVEVSKLAEVAARPVEEFNWLASPVGVETAEGEDYRRAVTDAVQRIRTGTLQKVVLSRTVPVRTSVDLCSTLVLGRMHNNPTRSFLIRIGGLRAVGFSPETIVEVASNGQVRTQPLAGTRALTGDDPERNERLRAELVSDVKEVYEHAISVRAACEDLGQVCRSGSLAISDFLAVKQRGTVQHLGSKVTGELAEGCGPWDAFAALFPAITVSGTPKAAACRWIREHEVTPRGLYGGAVIVADSEDNLDAALVLRTLFQQEGRTWLRAGAGIVAQSNSDREFEETCEKLRSIASNVVSYRGESAESA